MPDHQLTLFDPDDLHPDTGRVDDDPPTDLAAAGLTRRARRLPVRLQQVLIMRYVAGASLQGVAAHFDVDRAQALAWEREALQRLEDPRPADLEAA